MFLMLICIIILCCFMRNKTMMMIKLIKKSKNCYHDTFPILAPNILKCFSGRWGSLQRSPKSPSWIWGPLRGGEEKGKGWKEETGRGRGRGKRCPLQVDSLYGSAYVYSIMRVRTSAGCCALQMHVGYLTSHTWSRSRRSRSARWRST